MAIKTKAQIESWALAVIDCSRAGQRVEDDRVEIKRSWIDVPKAARRIAAIANAARTQPFLVLIGVEECIGPQPLPAEPEFSEWWAQVGSYFDHAPPRLEHIVVQGVHVLYFEPDQPPYVVKHRENPADASGLWEVPWREGARTRSARHADLIRILVPRARVPDFQVLHARASTGNTDKHVPALTVGATLYIAPQSPERIVLPFHRSGMALRWDTARDHVQLHGGLFPKGERKSKTIHFGSDEIVVDGPGRIAFSGFCEMPPEQVPAGKALELNMHLDPLPESEQLIIGATIPYTGAKDGRHFWGVAPPSDPPPTVTRYRRPSGWISEVTGGKPWSVRG